MALIIISPFSVWLLPLLSPRAPPSPAYPPREAFCRLWFHRTLETKTSRPSAAARHQRKVKKRARTRVSVTVNYCEWHATDWQISELLRRWWAPPPPRTSRASKAARSHRRRPLWRLFNLVPQFVPPLPPALRFVLGSCTKLFVCLWRFFSRHLLYCHGFKRSRNSGSKPNFTPAKYLFFWLHLLILRHREN